jgi:hypothetical protein
MRFESAMDARPESPKRWLIALASMTAVIAIGTVALVFVSFDSDGGPSAKRTSGAIEKNLTPSSLETGESLPGASGPAIGSQGGGATPAEPEDSPAKVYRTSNIGVKLADPSSRKLSPEEQARSPQPAPLSLSQETLDEIKVPPGSLIDTPVNDPPDR